MTFMAARVSDPTAHGGCVTLGSATVLIGGKPAARLGDVHACPVHGGGVIVTASFSVFIDGAPAARMLDLCGCFGAGMAGSGAGSGSGSGEGGEVSGRAGAEPKKGKDEYDIGPVEYTSESETVVGPYAEGSGQIGEKGAKGKGEAGVFKHEERDTAKVGDLEVSRTRRADVYHGKGEARGGGTGTGMPGGGSVDVAGARGTEEWGVKYEGFEVATGEAVEVGHAQAGGDWFMGDDGTRIGFQAAGKAGAEGLAAKKTGGLTVPLWEDLDIQIKAEASGSLGSVGGAAAAGGFWDRKTERFHIGGEGLFELAAGVGFKFDISIGRKAGGAAGSGAGGIPNLILAGEPTVLLA